MEAAKMVMVVTTMLLNLALFSQSLSAASSTSNPVKSAGTINHDNTRCADVERHCQSVLSSGAELKADATGGDHPNILMYRLSFMNGDWSQDAGQAPLLPFQGSYADPPPSVAAGPGLLEAVSLASFRITHMEMFPFPRRGAHVSAALSLTISRDDDRTSCSCAPSPMEKEPSESPEFELQPGIARLNLVFQGVYTETRSSSSSSLESGEDDDGDGGGGERVLCMVGDAALPVRSSNSTDPWDWAKNENRGGGSSSENLESFKPPVVSDGNILLVLRYPKTATLTNRAVHGVLTSTSNNKSDGAYFDTIRLVSQLYNRYGFQFRQEDDAESSSSDDLAWCGSKDDDDDSPFHDGEGDASMEMKQQHHQNRAESRPCDFIDQLSASFRDQVMEVVPNRNCKGTDEFCSRPGPFVSSRRSMEEKEDMAFTRSAGIAVSMAFQCKPLEGRAAARVAAVFRYVPPWEHQPTAAKRTGLSGMTMSAEGIWTPSTGRACMVGFLGADAPGKEEAACGYRVSLSVRRRISLTRRAAIVGQITAAVDGSRRHPPLLFQQRVNPGMSGGYDLMLRRMSYSYTKVEQALELLRLRASQPTGFRDTFVAKSLLSYPSIPAGIAGAAAAGGGGGADDEEMMVSLANSLAGDLDLQFQCKVRPPFVPEWIEGPFFELQILSIGTTIRNRYSVQQLSRPGIGRIDELFSSRVHANKQQILNVSAEFLASGNKCVDPRPVVLSLEGVYNPEDGRMHLIGCRNVRVLPTFFRGLEDDGTMDCSIQVTVEYPPTTTRWLVSRKAKVAVTSTRDDPNDDPLHFNRTELHTLPVVYQDQRLQHELTEPIVEALLCITMLLSTIAATTTQLRYIKSHGDVIAPYVSLTMLGVQALGYVATLVTNTRMLPGWPSQRYSRGSYYDHQHYLVSNILDTSVKALTLAALAVTARLAQKVRRSRARSRARSPLEPGRVPGDAVVLLYSFGVHLTVIFFAVAVQYWLSSSATTTLPPSRAGYSEPAHMRTRGAFVERYVGVVKEWFLLPQVIGNAVWRVNCKPLAAGYYAGVTATWLLPRVYGYLRPPVVNMYDMYPGSGHETHDHDDDVMGFCYGAANVVVPVAGVVFAVVVYVQQRWNYKIVGYWAMRTERNKQQHAY